jgi:hypothetical protein
MLVVVVLHETHDKLPHGGVPDVLEVLRQPFEFLVVLVLPGQKAFGLSEDALPIRPQQAQIGDRFRLSDVLSGGADRLGEIIEELMVTSLIVEDDAGEVGERRRLRGRGELFVGVDDLLLVLLVSGHMVVQVLLPDTRAPDTCHLTPPAHTRRTL